MSSNPVTVAVRIRPLNDKEKRVPDQEISLNFTEQHISLPKHDANFCFDLVLGPEHTNQTLYDSIASPIVESALLGINGTIFAYGQTASGKTFSMQGDAKCPGILRLAASQIFEQTAPDLDKGKFAFVASYIEIYNERVKDLLSGAGKGSDDLKIREDRVMGFYADGAVERAITSTKDVLALFAEGEKRRHVAGTDMNLKSSRSHTIFMINMTATHQQVTTKSRLSLVDLAGSESVRQTHAEGDRLKEGAQINKSLLALSMVISSLSSGKKDIGHVGYRDSKLTQILRPSLSGNCKTAVLVCVSPAMTYAFETLSSLKFASSAKQIKTSYVVNRTAHQTNMRSYQDQIDFLTKTLQEEQGRNNSEASLEQDRKALEDALRRKDLEWEEMANESAKELEDLRIQTQDLEHQLGEREEVNQELEQELARLQGIVREWDEAYKEQAKQLETCQHALQAQEASLAMEKETQSALVAQLNEELVHQRLVVQSQTETMQEYQQELHCMENLLVDEKTNAAGALQASLTAQEQADQEIAKLQHALRTQATEFEQRIHVLGTDAKEASMRLAVDREQILRQGFQEEKAALLLDMENQYVEDIQEVERAGMKRESKMQQAFEVRLQQEADKMMGEFQVQLDSSEAAKQAEIAELKSQFELHQSKLDEFDGLQASVSELERVNEQLREESGILQAKLVVLEQDLTKARMGEHLIESAETERNALLTFRIDSEQIRQDLRAQLQAERTEVKTLKQQLALTEAEMAKLKHDRDRMRNQHEHELANLENQLKDDENLGMITAQRENHRLKQAQAKLHSSLQEQDEQIELMKKREQELMDRVAKLEKCKFTATHKLRFEELLQRNQALEGEVSDLKQRCGVSTKRRMPLTPI
ncbi:hypothetical protein BASA81_002013 [Batrachochytrium salamandrivorans]|nr:hypothetical protein BASA81_002013 [Batrachochytrium salamandrivorans]